MDAQFPQPGRCPITRHASDVNAKPAVHPDEIVKVPAKPVRRRDLLKVGGIGATAAVAIAGAGTVAWMPKRTAQAQDAGTAFSDIQFDIGKFVHPAQTIAGVPVDFGVTYTFLAPAALTRNPTKADQQILENALLTIEANFPFSPSGVFTFVSYGLPYFNRLPQSLVSSHMPRLASDQSRSVLEEAVPGPTDFGQPGISKAQKNFQVPVRIEHNDVLFTVRSDSLGNILNVAAWFNGSNNLNGRSVASPDFDGLFNFGPPRLNFVQPGLPRKLANEFSNFGIAPFTTFATEINPASSMWMGFVDQQLDGSAPAASNVTFAGTGPNSSGTGAAHLTTAVAGNYFDNGSIQHLSHNLDDLQQFYNKDPNAFTGAEDFSERIQYMFSSQKADGSHALPFPQDPHDGFTNGGGLGAPTGDLTTQQQSAFLSNFTLGPNAIFQNFDPDLLAQQPPVQKLRAGHNVGLQRSSRAADGTPLHIRNDGPGLSSLDVPDGSTLPSLEFTVFVPTAEFFRVMRINQASQDLVETGGSNGGTATNVPAGVEPSDDEDDGLERFISATRRQNFLIPPRRHRSFPLLELT